MVVGRRSPKAVVAAALLLLLVGPSRSVAPATELESSDPGRLGALVAPDRTGVEASTVGAPSAPAGPRPVTETVVLDPGSPLAVTLADWSEGDLGPIEAYAAYEPQERCDPAPKPGAVALSALLLQTHPGTASSGIVRACDRGATSEHKEGRAVDWSISGADQRAAAEQAIARLLATDEAGNRHALARRMGVMYIIWDGWIWGAYLAEQGWRPYDGPHRHDDHVHISLSWDGALAETSLWRAARAQGWFETVPSTGPVPDPRRWPSTTTTSSTPTTTPTTSTTVPPTPSTTTTSTTVPPTTSTTVPQTATTAVVTPTVPSPPPSEPPKETPTEPPVRAFVQFEPGTPDTVRTADRSAAGATLVFSLRAVDGLELWSLPGDRVDAALATLDERPHVRWTERDRTVSAVAAAHADPAPPAADAAAIIGTAPANATDWANPGEVPGNGVDDDGNGRVDDVHGWDFCDADADPTGTPASDVGAVLTAAGLPADAPVAALRVLCSDGTGRLSDVVLALDHALSVGLAVLVDATDAPSTGSAAHAAAVAATEAAGRRVVALAEMAAAGTR